MFSSARTVVLVGMGFVAGLTVSAGVVFATTHQRAVLPTEHAYVVSLDEVKQNLVWADEFSKDYSRKVTLSDGSVREISLHPVTVNGQDEVELTDHCACGDMHSYMGPNGTTTNGHLMISLKDEAGLRAVMAKATGRTPPG